jgi:hypothetical protein
MPNSSASLGIVMKPEAIKEFYAGVVSLSYKKKLNIF